MLPQIFTVYLAYRPALTVNEALDINNQAWCDTFERIINSNTSRADGNFEVCDYLHVMLSLKDMSWSTY